VLDRLSYGDTNKWVCIAALAGLCAGFNLLAYLILRFNGTKYVMFSYIIGIDVVMNSCNLLAYLILRFLGTKYIPSHDRITTPHMYVHVHPKDTFRRVRSC
jgi:hypothetical protein